MDTNEVVEMIDAITEGRHYETQVETDEETAQLMISCDSHGFTFETLTPVGPIGARVLNPRTAREIAGALVAWANRKDGGLPGGAILDLRDLRQQRHSEQATESGSREKWYRRNIQSMTQETKDRNLRDLRGIQKTLSGGSLEWDDIQAAITILLNAGAGPVSNV